MADVTYVYRDGFYNWMCSLCGHENYEKDRMCQFCATEPGWKSHHTESTAGCDASDVKDAKTNDASQPLSPKLNTTTKVNHMPWREERTGIPVVPHLRKVLVPLQMKISLSENDVPTTTHSTASSSPRDDYPEDPLTTAVAQPATTDVVSALPSGGHKLFLDQETPQAATLKQVRKDGDFMIKDDKVDAAQDCGTHRRAVEFDDERGSAPMLPRVRLTPQAKTTDSLLRMLYPQLYDAQQQGEKSRARGRDADINNTASIWGRWKQYRHGVGGRRGGSGVDGCQSPVAQRARRNLASRGVHKNADLERVSSPHAGQASPPQNSTLNGNNIRTGVVETPLDTPRSHVSSQAQSPSALSSPAPLHRSPTPSTRRRSLSPENNSAMPTPHAPSTMDHSAFYGQAESPTHIIAQQDLSSPSRPMIENAYAGAAEFSVEQPLSLSQARTLDIFDSTKDKRHFGHTTAQWQRRRKVFTPLTSVQQQAAEKHTAFMRDVALGADVHEVTSSCPVMPFVQWGSTHSIVGVQNTLLMRDWAGPEGDGIRAVTDSTKESKSARYESEKQQSKKADGWVTQPIKQQLEPRSLEPEACSALKNVTECSSISKVGIVPATSLPAEYFARKAASHSPVRENSLAPVALCGVARKNMKDCHHSACRRFFSPTCRDERQPTPVTTHCAPLETDQQHWKLECDISSENMRACSVTPLVSPPRPTREYPCTHRWRCHAGRCAAYRPAVANQFQTVPPILRASSSVVCCDGTLNTIPAATGLKGRRLYECKSSKKPSPWATVHGTPQSAPEETAHAAISSFKKESRVQTDSSAQFLGLVSNVTSRSSPAKALRDKPRMSANAQFRASTCVRSMSPPIANPASAPHHCALEGTEPRRFGSTSHSPVRKGKDVKNKLDRENCGYRERWSPGNTTRVRIKADGASGLRRPASGILHELHPQKERAATEDTANLRRGSASAVANTHLSTLRATTPRGAPLSPIVQACESGSLNGQIPTLQPYSAGEIEREVRQRAVNTMSFVGQPRDPTSLYLTPRGRLASQKATKQHVVDEIIAALHRRELSPAGENPPHCTGGDPAIVPLRSVSLATKNIGVGSQGVLPCAKGSKHLQQQKLQHHQQQAVQKQQPQHEERVLALQELREHLPLHQSQDPPGYLSAPTLSSGRPLPTAQVLADRSVCVRAPGVTEDAVAPTALPKLPVLNPYYVPERDGAHIVHVAEAQTQFSALRAPPRGYLHHVRHHDASPEKGDAPSACEQYTEDNRDYILASLENLNRVRPSLSHRLTRPSLRTQKLDTLREIPKQSARLPSKGNRKASPCSPLRGEEASACVREPSTVQGATSIEATSEEKSASTSVLRHDAESIDRLFDNGSQAMLTTKEKVDISNKFPIVSTKVADEENITLRDAQALWANESTENQVQVNSAQEATIDGVLGNGDEARKRSVRLRKTKEKISPRHEDSQRFLRKKPVIMRSKEGSRPGSSWQSAASFFAKITRSNRK